MNRLLQDEDETRDYDRMDSRRGQGGGQDREISLGTTMLLGIFFAIALLCAVFFGFGYSLGSRHAAPAAAAAAPAEPAPGTFSGFKPSPFGQGSAKSSPSASAPVATPPPPTVTVKTPPVEKTTAQSSDFVPAPAPVPAPIVRQAPVAAPAPTPPVVAASPTTSVVQVAAVSHQEDADLLVSTLKRRGYAVAIHQEPQDHLLHVQIGPFATRKDAEAMRQRLLNDGFNAIVK